MSEDTMSTSPAVDSPTIAVVGELNVDLILERINALPAIGKERIAENMTFTMGSSSAILAANAGALGLDIRFIGRVGTDVFGDFMTDALENRGVQTNFVLETPDAATGLTAIFTFEGDRGMLTYPGAMDELVIEDMPWGALEKMDHLHLSSYYLQPGIRADCPELFRRVREMGLTTSLDTNWDPDEEWGDDVLEVLQHVDVFLPNDAEAELISGYDNLDDAMRFLAGYAGTIVVTCGAKGVRARSGEREYHLDALPVEPVDAVGAGDSFNAGFLYEYVRRQPLEQCLQFGIVTSAFSTQESGGTDAFSDMDSFREFLEGMSEQLTHPVSITMKS